MHSNMLSEGGIRQVFDYSSPRLRKYNLQCHISIKQYLEKSCSETNFNHSIDPGTTNILHLIQVRSYF